MFTKIGLVSRPELKVPTRLIGEIIKWAQKNGLKCYLEKHLAEVTGVRDGLVRERIISTVDLIISLGGDGTILSVARSLQGKAVPILGINFGKLGFLTEAMEEDALAFLGEMKKRKYILDERYMLEAKVIRKGNEIKRSLALNDIAINGGNLSRLVQLEVKVDGQILATYHGDGVLVSTATGSTAYSLAAGGPLIQPQAKVLVITPICPHVLSSRPFVTPASSEIQIKLKSRREGIIAAWDGQETIILEPDDKIMVKSTAKKAVFMRKLGWDYFERLREKMGWDS